MIATWITWNDHNSVGDCGWYSVEEVVSESGPIVITTVGIILKDAENHLVLGLNLSSDDGVNGNITVLKSDILSRKDFSYEDVCSFGHSRPLRSARASRKTN